MDGTLSHDGRLFLPSERANEYTRRIKRAIPDGVARFCVGLEVDFGGQPVGKTERTLQNIATIAALQAYEEDKPDPTRSAAADIIAQDMREWYRALRLGEQLGMVGAAFTERGESMENIFLLAPVKDADLTRKLGLLGFRGGTDESREAGLPDEGLAVQDSFTDDMQFRSQVMSTGFMPYWYPGTGSER